MAKSFLPERAFSIYSILGAARISPAKAFRRLFVLQSRMPKRGDVWTLTLMHRPYYEPSGLKAIFRMTAPPAPPRELMVSSILTSKQIDNESDLLLRSLPQDDPRLLPSRHAMRSALFTNQRARATLVHVFRKNCPTCPKLSIRIQRMLAAEPENSA